MSLNEHVSRSKSLLANITTGLYFHNDNIKYQLYLQSCNLNSRSLLKSTEAKDIYKRLVEKYGEKRGHFPSFTIDSLPGALQDMIRGSDLYKVEWMYGGSYKIHASDNYKSVIMDPADILGIARDYKIPYKLVDFSNSNSLDTFYKLWIESVFSPMVAVEMSLGVFNKQAFEVDPVNMKIMTFINSYDSMITVTVLYRKQRYLF